MLVQVGRLGGTKDGFSFVDFLGHAMRDEEVFIRLDRGFIAQDAIFRDTRDTAASLHHRTLTEKFYNSTGKFGHAFMKATLAEATIRLLKDRAGTTLQ